MSDFTRYLYVKEEVEVAMLVSLLNGDRERALFWAYELYYSAPKAELVASLWRIYYEFYAMLNGVNLLDDVTIPTLIIWTLADETDAARSAFAYAAKTAKKKLAHTTMMSRLGHFNEIWRSDPYWMEKAMLTYFKSVLEPVSGLIGNDPGFESGGPRTANPYLMNFNLRKFDPAMFLSQDSISDYLVGEPDGACRSEIGLP